MACPLLRFLSYKRASVARQVGYYLQRKESADENQDRVSHFLCPGFYRRRYSGSDPTVAATPGGIRTEKLQATENKGNENLFFA
jgi:hypothetical protein